MSRGPSEEGVRALVDAVRRAESLRSRLTVTRDAVTELSKDLGALAAETREATSKVMELLDGMDVRAPGNYWENRMAWLVAEVIRQVGAGHA